MLAAVARNQAQPAKPTVLTYALEQLFVDQDPDFVIDSIPALLAWVPGKSKKKAAQPFRFPVEHTAGGVTCSYAIDLTWSLGALAAHDPTVGAHAKRLRTKKSVQREHVTELAGYALSFVAISLLMPGRRVIGMNEYAAPDLLFDLTPDALRGVEAAARASGGRNGLLAVRDGKSGQQGKRQQLLDMPDVVEAHLSLWSASARCGIMEQVKP